LLVVCGEGISLGVHRRVRWLSEKLLGWPEIRNIHPAYASVLVEFDALRFTHAGIERRIRALKDNMDSSGAEGRLVTIPVCYGGEFGPDLAWVAAHNGLTPEKVVAIHSSVDYLVYFLGFSPGFPYLGGMPPSIAAPRLSSPRKHVPVGSVAIGGDQTGVYPVSSPGGWRIIGKTPVRLFGVDRNPPALLALGDRVRFTPIGEDQFERASPG
jgi:5-oxoprolinase (ATP-hydrolysing) subunit B